MQHVTTYQRITRALTVLDIAQPITFKFDKTMPIGDVLSELGENIYGAGFILIEDKKRPYGFVTPSSNFRHSDQTAAIDAIAEKIDPCKIVSSNLSLCDLMPLWRNSYFYLILNGATITHFVSQHHMDSAPVKTALFAMTAELEGLILNLLMNDLTKVKERFEILPEKERKRIADRCKKYFPKQGEPRQKVIDIAEPSILYIQHTLFSQKIQILKKSPDLIEFAFRDDDPEILSKNLCYINKFRNQMAHGGSILHVTPIAGLHEIVDLLEGTIVDLRSKLVGR